MAISTDSIENKNNTDFNNDKSSLVSIYTWIVYVFPPTYVYKRQGAEILTVLDMLIVHKCMKFFENPKWIDSRIQMSIVNSETNGTS